MTNLEAIQALLTSRVIQKVNEGTISKPRAKKLIIEGILNLTGTKVVEKIREEEEGQKESKWKKVARGARKGAIYTGGAIGGALIGNKLGGVAGKVIGGKSSERQGKKDVAFFNKFTGENNPSDDKDTVDVYKHVGGIMGEKRGKTVGTIGGGAAGLAAAHALNRKLDEKRKRKEAATQQINKQMAAKKLRK